MKKLPNSWRELWVAVAMALVFGASYATLAIKKYDAHQTRGDLTAYAQGFWNTLHGHFMASTFNYSVHNYWDGHFREITATNSNIFGIHFNPILLFLLPFYAAYPHPQTLLVLQALILTGSSLVIFMLARDLLKNKYLAYIIQFSYLLNIALISAVLSEFHAYPLTVLLSALMIWFSRTKKDWWFYISLVLLLLVQENAAIPAVFFGLYLTVEKPTRTRGIITTLAGIAYLLITTKLLIPRLSPTGTYLFEGAYGSPLGGSYLEMIGTAIHRPQVVFTTLLSRDNFVYLSKILLPTLPLALLSPLTLLTSILTLTPNLISSAGILKSLAMHYDAVILPYSYYALILGVANLFRHTKARYQKWALIGASGLILLTTLIQYRWLAATRFSPKCVVACHFYSALDREKDQVIAAVPAGASVSTQDYLSANFSSRAGVYLFPVYYNLADYVVISKGEEIWPQTSDSHAKYLTLLTQSSDHTVAFETAHFVVFKKTR